MVRTVIDPENPDFRTELGQIATPVNDDEAASKAYVDAGIRQWQPNTTYQAGQILLRSATTGDPVTSAAGGLFYVRQEITTPASFSTQGLLALPLTEVEWAGKLFDERGFYETGDLATIETSPSSGVFQAYILSGIDQDGRLNVIPEADRPGGGNNQWQLIMGGAGSATFRGLTDVVFEGDSTSFAAPAFNGRPLESASFQGLGTDFRDNNAIPNRRWQFEVNVDSNFQRSEVELDFASGTNIRRPADNLVSVEITGTCEAPLFLEGSGGGLQDRVRISIIIANDADQIAAFAGFTDSEGVTWDQASGGVYEFGVGSTAAQQQQFTADMVAGIEIQRTRSITHQYIYWDEDGNEVQVTDAADFRDQLQTQPATDLLSVSTQWPTGGDNTYTGTEGRENQIPTVRGLDNFLANGQGRSLVETYTPTAQQPLPTDIFSGWFIKNITTNEMWFWNPSSAAISSNSPRDAGAYVRIAGDTSVSITTESPPTTAPDVANEANIRINRFAEEVWLWEGPNATDWVNLVNSRYYNVPAEASEGRPEFMLKQGDIVRITGINAGVYMKVDGASVTIAENFSGDLTLAAFATSPTLSLQLDGSQGITGLDRHRIDSLVIPADATAPGLEGITFYAGSSISSPEEQVVNNIAESTLTYQTASGALFAGNWRLSAPSSTAALDPATWDDFVGNEVAVDISTATNTAIKDAFDNLTAGQRVELTITQGTNFAVFNQLSDVTDTMVTDPYVLIGMGGLVRSEGTPSQATATLTYDVVEDNPNLGQIQVETTGNSTWLFGDAELLLNGTAYGGGAVNTVNLTWTFGMPTRGRDVQGNIIYPCIMFQENLTGDGVRLQAAHFDIESVQPATLYRVSDDGNSWTAVGTNPITGGIHFPANFSFIRFAISFNENSADNIRQNISNILRGVYTCLLYTSPSPRDS